jgi:hypothetical protein
MGWRPNSELRTFNLSSSLARGRRETSIFRRGSCVILRSGIRMEKRERTKRWSPNEMDTKSFRFRVSFILGQINKKPDLQKKDRGFSKLPFTAFHRRPIVKCIQAGFLAYGSS